MERILFPTKRYLLTSNILISHTLLQLYCLIKDIGSRLFYNAMAEKGYNPVNQMVGYIMSGDPTYITSYKNARSLIMKVERDELVEELLKEYIRNKSWEMK